MRVNRLRIVLGLVGLVACGAPTALPGGDSDDAGQWAPLGPISQLQLAVSPSTVLADGAHSSTVRATWTDMQGRPFTGRRLVLSGNANALLSQTALSTNCAGAAQLSWSSRVAGSQSLLGGDLGRPYARARVNFTCPGTFLRPQGWPVQTDTVGAVALGDFDADGWPDLLSALPSSNALSLAKGFGNGRFEVPVTYATGSGPVDLVAADVNGDGKLDALSANGGGNSISVLLGDGNGLLGSAKTFAAGTSPSALVLADLNADGSPDLVVAGGSANNLAVLMGSGSNGNFFAAQTVALGGAAGALCAADFDADGRLDVGVLSAGGNQLSVLRGSGNGNLTLAWQIGTCSLPTGLACADLNRDGWGDFAVSCSGSASVRTYLGNGRGGFGAAANVPVGAAPNGLLAVDLNRDGSLDLAVALSGDGALVSLLGNGDGNFVASATPALGVGASADSLAIADLNGDGSLDVVSNTGLASTALYMGNSSSLFLPVQQSRFPNTSTDGSLLGADFNNDGNQDLINSWGGISILFGRGDGTFGQPVSFGAVNTSFGFALSDFDRNGYMDVASSVFGNAAKRMQVFRNVGGSMTGPTVYGISDFHPGAVAAGDLTGDLYPDIAFYTQNNRTVYLWRNDGAGNFTSVGILNNFSTSLGPLQIAEMTGDSNNDLVDCDGSSLRLFVNDGNINFPTSTSVGLSGTPVQMMVADLTGNGMQDVVLAMGSQNLVTSLVNGGGAVLSIKQQVSVGYNVSSVAVADFNADGYLDVAVPASSTQVAVYFGIGDGTFSLNSTYYVGGSPSLLWAADFNNDGAADLAVVLRNDLVAVLLNARCR